MKDIPPAGSLPTFGRATLEDCDREPIHIPGSIQPHGCLVALDRAKDRIVQAAGDFRAVLGIGRDDVIGARLQDLFGAAEAARLIAAVPPEQSRPVPLKTYEVELDVPAGRVDAIIHEYEGVPIFEFEPARRAGAGGTTETLMQVQHLLARLLGYRSVPAFCQGGADLIREITGFGRVMIYQFLPDGSGHVVAEARDPAMDSYLGLHYPESDIPKQARDLYLRNWLRLIPDVGYTPQPLQPAVHPETGRALDLSYASLRSVSPLHVQYLNNMGVGASMSISIVINDKLWGLIACHHPVSHAVPCDIRAACEVFGQVFSLQLQSRLEAEDYEYRLQQKSVHDRLLNRLSEEAELREGLIRYCPSLLDYVQAEGVAIFIDGSYADFGRTPGEARALALIKALNAREDGVFATDCLAELVPEAAEHAAEHAAEAAGMLALSVSRTPRDYVMWFRPEVVGTVAWAGNPTKPVETTEEGDRLTPRRSFAVWQETVRGRSRPWKKVEIEAAQALRISILEVVLRRIDEVARERARNAERQAVLLAELDHRVKNTLANIQALMRFTRASAYDIDDYVEKLERRIACMANAHSLLSRNHWKGADLRQLVEEELGHFQNAASPRAAVHGEPVRLTPKATLSIALVIHELASNAATYGALSDGNGSVDLSWWRDEPDRKADLLIAWRESGGPPVTPPSRTGFGRQLVERSLKYELEAAVDLRFLPSGVECDIRIPAHNVTSEPTMPPDTANSKTEAGLNILVVEDSMITAMDIEQRLQRDGHVVHGPTGRVPEALALVRTEGLDLAILDINLGDTDSFAIAEELQARRVPFFFLTGYTPENVLPKRFLDIPWLAKPFDDQSLRRAIVDVGRNKDVAGS